MRNAPRLAQTEAGPQRLCGLPAAMGTSIPSLLDLLGLHPGRRRGETPAAREHLVFVRPTPAAADLAGQAAGLLEQAGLAEGSAISELYPHLGGFLVKLTDSQAAGLRSLEGVSTVEPDAPLPPVQPLPDPEPTPLLPPSAPGAAAPGPDDTEVTLPTVLVSYGNIAASSGETVPWGVQAVWQGRDISSLGNVGAGRWAFVIDSGILATTGDLAINTTWSRSWVTDESPFTDGVGHGTHVAGTIAALANGIGVVGVAPGAEVVSLKVFNSSGGGASYSTIISAIDYAVNVITTNNLDLSRVVINMSLGGPFSSALDTAVRNAADLGIRFAIAAGNGDSNGIGVDADTVSPASAGDHPNVYCVSAVDSSYRMATFSNWDRIEAGDSVDDVDLAAPGVGVISYNASGQLVSWSGTSMAAPHVAGLLLMGGVTPGDLVIPNAAGAPDPFAWGTGFPPAAGTPVPSYALSGPAGVDEGASLSLSLTSTNAAAGSTLYWRFSGSGISTADFSDLAALNGSVVLQSDGRAQINATVAADLLTEGNETLTVDLFSDAALSNRVAGTTVILNDASRTPAPVGDLVLWGTTANDSVVGGGGNDRITGVQASGVTGAALGRGQIDTLSGGAGADVFVLGDSRGMFYDDGASNRLGSADYARITDFQSGVDKLQLVSGFYLLSSGGGLTSLYRDFNRDGRLTSSGSLCDELIAVLNTSIQSSDVIWV